MYPNNDPIVLILCGEPGWGAGVACCPCAQEGARNGQRWLCLACISFNLKLEMFLADLC